jgi:hypothetical protein
VDVPPDRVLGIDMATGASNEKKKDRSKNRQPKNHVTPAVRQVHVVLWDAPPKADPQEGDTDLEPDHIRANPIGSATSQHRGHAGPFRLIRLMCSMNVRTRVGMTLSRHEVSRSTIHEEPCGKEVASCHSMTVSMILQLFFLIVRRKS